MMKPPRRNPSRRDPRHADGRRGVHLKTSAQYSLRIRQPDLQEPPCAAENLPGHQGEKNQQRAEGGLARNLRLRQERRRPGFQRLHRARR